MKATSQGFPRLLLALLEPRGCQCRARWRLRPGPFPLLLEVAGSSTASQPLLESLGTTSPGSAPALTHRNGMLFSVSWAHNSQDNAGPTDLSG